MWLRDPKLSFKAKGLLAYLMSHAEGYRLTATQIIAETTDGRDAVRAALRELETQGYIHRSQRRGPNGRLGEATYVVGPVAGKPVHGPDQRKRT